MRVDPHEKLNLVDGLNFANERMQQAFLNEESLESFLIGLNQRMTNGLEFPADNVRRVSYGGDGCIQRE